MWVVDLVVSLVVVGDFEAECYYCGQELSSLSKGALAIQCGWHLSHEHDQYYEDLDGETREEIYAEMFPGDMRYLEVDG